MTLAAYKTMVSGCLESGTTIGGWSPEGKRFLVIKEVESTEDNSAQGRPRKIIVVTNWFEELNDKAPVE